MPADLTDLGRRLVALEGFVWSAGMRSFWDGPGSCNGSTWRILSVAEDGLPLRAIIEDGTHALHAWGMAGQPGAAAGHVPDLTDAANGGVLLGALGAGYVVECINDGRWYVRDVERDCYHYGTLAAACARALVARGWYRRPA